MAVYDNKEESATRKKIPGDKSAARSAGEFARQVYDAPLSYPTRMAVSAASIPAAGIREVGQLWKQGYTEAAKQPSTAAKVGSGLRTLVTTPVAAIAGAGEETIRQATPLWTGAKEFGRAFAGIPENTPSSRNPQVVTPPDTSPAARVAAPVSTATPTSTSVDPQSSSGRRVKFGETGQAGSGIIMTPTGKIGYSPDEGMVKDGDPSASINTGPAARFAAPASKNEGYYLYNGEKVPVQRQTGRMVLADDNFNRPSPRPVREVVEPTRRISDIAEPKTIGEVPVYRRKVQALQSDIAAEQQEKQREQQQTQFEQRQAQQQQQFVVDKALEAQRQAQQQAQFEAGSSLEERRLAGTQQRQQAELELKQRQEASRQEQQSRIDEAIGAFSEAKTPQERKKAADMINILSGKGLAAEKSAVPAWKPKEVSDAVGAFEERFKADTAAGINEKGASLQMTMFARDPGLFRAAYGNMSPKAAEFGERLMTYPLDKLKADEKFKALLDTAGKDVSAEELRAQLIADYYALSQGR